MEPVPLHQESLSVPVTARRWRSVDQDEGSHQRVTMLTPSSQTPRPRLQNREK